MRGKAARSVRSEATCTLSLLVESESERCGRRRSRAREAQARQGWGRACLRELALLLQPAGTPRARCPSAARRVPHAPATLTRPCGARRTLLGCAAPCAALRLSPLSSAPHSPERADWKRNMHRKDKLDGPERRWRRRRGDSPECS